MKIIKYVKKPQLVLLYLASKGFFNWMSDENFLKMVYKIRFDKPLNLKDPQTYNEKLQWLKLYDRKDVYTEMVDKSSAKKYVEKIIGEQYIIPTIGTYKHFEEIDFEKLPNKFVIKPTHTSGDVFICHDKTKIDFKKLQKKIEKWLKRKYYLKHREWPYKNIEPQIIIEELLQDTKNFDLKDYKFFCFSGKVKMLFIASNRQGMGETYFDFFDNEYNHLDFTNGHENAPVMPKKPKNFELMKKFAEEISKDLIHARIDFYEANGKIYFGEITFYHWSGLVPYNPKEWDYKIGKWITLPKERGK